MADKKINIYYYYPIHKIDNKEKVVDLSGIFNELKSIPANKRVMDGKDENVQLKKITYDSDTRRWNLCFLRNRSDAPFITKLDDDTTTAESLGENEFVGAECCLIYDEPSKIVSLQNNVNSISFGKVGVFLAKYYKKNIFLSPIVLKEEYCTISDNAGINYKSIVFGYTDINKLTQLADNEGEEEIKALTKLANSISSINGRIELGVGRNKSFLEKIKLRNLVDFLKNNREITKTLKVKMIDEDGIRFIDLLTNKASDEISIYISKDDPKTFDKILSSMDMKFDKALGETFDKCKLLIELK